jgi:hypothetical protein
MWLSHLPFCEYLQDVLHKLGLLASHAIRVVGNRDSDGGGHRDRGRFSADRGGGPADETRGRQTCSWDCSYGRHVFSPVRHALDRPARPGHPEPSQHQTTGLGQPFQLLLMHTTTRVPGVAKRCTKSGRALVGDAARSSRARCQVGRGGLEPPTCAVIRPQRCDSRTELPSVRPGVMWSAVRRKSS